MSKVGTLRFPIQTLEGLMRLRFWACPQFESSLRTPQKRSNTFLLP